ncbi:MAG: YkgJ family cysteine cluster protein [Bacteroidota bacterium]
MPHLVTALDEIKILAEERENENDGFRVFLKSSDGKAIDTLVHQLNNTITPQIDCTACGNCCKSLMINVTTEESENLASHLQTTVQDIKEKYLDESAGGKMVISKIPCHFLSGTKCSIYEHRFEGCREFPHLNRDNFTNRLFGIMMYYPVCPIIFNVVEALKIKTGFHK